MSRPRALVVGNEGYIGTVLCRRLQDTYEVFGCDIGYYRDAYLVAPRWDLPATRSVDVRDLRTDELVGIDVVICLSDLNDPTSHAFPDAARSIGVDGNVRLARSCRQAGVKRFLYSSSASVYGRTGSCEATETDEIQPLTTYAQCKADAEAALLELAEDDFIVTCVRNATVYGASPRARLDLLVNRLCAIAAARGELRLTSDGTAWRPFIHVEDVCEAMTELLAMPAQSVAGHILNVGDTAGNWRVIDVAEAVATITGTEIARATDERDQRSYKLDVTKLGGLGIVFTRDLDEELERLVAVFSKLGLREPDLESRSVIRLKQIHHLRATGQLDSNLRWSPA